MIKIKFLKLIALMLILNSCTGQKHKNELPQKIPLNKIEETKSNTEYSLLSISNNQISQVVRTIFQDSRGYLWFGTQNGAFKLEGDSLLHIDNVTSEQGTEVTVKDITESKDGKIWLGHTDGISSVDGNTVTNYYESDGLISNDVWSIATDTNGNIWIGTIEGVCIFNGQEFTEFVLPEGIIDSSLGISSTKMVHNLFQDSKGTLWFSTNAGLFSYADNKLTNVSKKAGIQTNFINEVFEDVQGELWVSTKIGLYNLKDNQAKNITKEKIEIGKGIGSIGEDKYGNLWFVSNQHFLFTYNKEKLSEYKKTENNKGPIVFQIFKDQEQRLWFVGFGGAFRLEDGKFINVTKNGPW